MSLRPEIIDAEGFLSFLEPATVDLRHADIWAITGKNGVGKSSLLNAITFALFGMVHGKKKGLDEIIHDRADKARVCFTFALDDRRYRVTRIALRRPSGIASEGLIEWHDGAAWQPVPYTRKIGEMEDWILRRLRVRPESFTASAALMQNEQMKLFEATPAEMRKTLTDLAGLDYYQALERHVRDLANEVGGRSKSLTDVLEGIPVVHDTMLEAAETEAVDAARAAETANAERERAVRDLARGEKKAALTKEKNDLGSETERAAELAARVEDLREGVEAARTAREQMNLVAAVVRGRGSLAAIEKERQEQTERLAGINRALIEARTALAAAARREEEASARYRIRVSEAESQEKAERHATERLRAAEERERLASELRRMQAEVAGIEEETAGLSEVESIVRHRDRITTLVSEMAALDRAIEERGVARIEVNGQTAELAAHRTSLTAAGAKVDALKARIETSTRDLQDLEGRLVQTRNAYQLEKGALGPRLQAADSDECHTCGEPIKGEKARSLRQEIEERRARLEATGQAGVALKQEHEAAARALEALKTEYSRAEADLAVLRRTVSVAESTLETLKEKAESRLKAANDLWLAMVAGAAEVGMETPDPKQSDAVDVLRRRIEERRVALAATLPRWEQMNERRAVGARLRTDMERVSQQHAALPDPGASIEEVRAEADAARAALADLRALRDEAATEAEARRAELAAKSTETQDLEGRVRELTTRLEESARRHAEVTEDVAAAWRDAVSAGWPQAETPTLDDVDALKSAATLLDELKKNLEKAEEADRKIASLRERLALIAEELEAHDDAPPLDAARSRDRETRQAVEETQRRLREATSNRDALTAQAERRRQISQELDGIDAEASRVRALVKPLGRSGLQARLMHRALVGIIEAANDVLTRISDAGLSLELHLGEDDDDFEIRVRDALSPDRPKSFSFISGGMKFRVAVAMAIGIGQYLAARSNTHRVEMLIIDEGFGALDEEALDAMLMELERISNDVGTVIVVSHNTKVHDSIESRYHVTRDEETARVEREMGMAGALVA